MVRSLDLLVFLSALVLPLDAQQTFVPTPPPQTYFQMGAFRTEANAQWLAKSLIRQGYAPRLRKDGILYRVFLTVLESEAPALVQKLTRDGRNGFLQVTQEPLGTDLELSTE